MLNCHKLFLMSPFQSKLTYIVKIQCLNLWIMQVEYECEGFLHKNRDTVMEEQVSILKEGFLFNVSYHKEMVQDIQLSIYV